MKAKMEDSEKLSSEKEEAPGVESCVNELDLKKSKK